MAILNKVRLPLILLMGLLGISACGGNGVGTQSAGPQPTTTTLAVPTVGAVATIDVVARIGKSPLVGATDAKLGQFAQDWARQQLRAKGTPEVLLARSVTPAEMPGLGLGCAPNFITIEEPPLMAVILRGEFTFRGSGPGWGNIPPPVAGQKQYVLYIFDVWAGRPTITIASVDGAAMKQALHDSTLPDDPNAQLSTDCGEPQIPMSQRHYHYGDSMPGMIAPTLSPPPPTATHDTLPAPIATAPTKP